MRSSCSVPRQRLLSAAGLHEDAVALQVDDLLGLRNRESNGIVPALMGIGSVETGFLHALGGILLDDPRGLVDAVRSVRGWTNAVAFVFDGWRRRSVGFARSSPADEPAPRRFEFREHGCYWHNTTRVT